MAIGFGSTSGVGSTDRIESPLTASSTTRTWACWVYANSWNNRIWDKQDSAQTELVWLYTGAFDPRISFQVAHSTTAGWWWVTAPTTGSWFHLAVSYDNSSTSNDPNIYFDGVLQTETEEQTPAGTPNTTSDPYVLGNRKAGDRVHDGMLAEWGVWDRILTAGEIAALAEGYTPDNFPNELVSYDGLIRDSIDLVGGPTSVTGTAVQNHPRIISPSAQILQFPSVTGVVTYFKTVTGSITPAGALATTTAFKQVVSGSITVLGAIAKKTFKELSGSVTASGALTKKTSITLEGSIILSGSLVASFTVLQAVAGSILMTGAVAGVVVATAAYSLLRKVLRPVLRLVNRSV